MQGGLYDIVKQNIFLADCRKQEIFPFLPTEVSRTKVILSIRVPHIMTKIAQTPQPKRFRQPLYHIFFLLLAHSIGQIIAVTFPCWVLFEPRTGTSPLYCSVPFLGREYSVICNPLPPLRLPDNGFSLHGLETVSKVVDLARIRGHCIALQHQFEVEHDLRGLT
jgi:hypothetical protein